MNERWWAPTNRFAEIVRFGAAGLANTLFTIGLYELFVEVLGPVTAYAIAWAAGLLLVVVCYPATVYRLEAGLWRRLGLHTLLAKLIESGDEAVPWDLTACLLTLARFCGQKSELEVAERW